jgi:L-amino acid N-acyltransferase YncA
MLAPQTVRAVDAYWAGDLGCTPDEFRSTTPVVLLHGAGWADYPGAYVMRLDGAAPVLSLPPELLDRFGPPLAAAARDGLAADGRWAEILGTVLERTVGPAWIGYASAETLRNPVSHAEIRPLTPGDAPLVERLLAACTPAELEQVTTLPDSSVAVGAVVGGELAAICGYEVWGGTIAHLSVFTHGGHRGGGLGRAVVSAAATLALEHGLVPQYRVIETNAASRAVAEALGFERYATSLALRFRPSPTA